MILKSVAVRNLRNLATQEIPLHPSVNLFVGDNGEGKTNVLEAMYFLATGKSFRTNHLSSIVAFDEKNVFVSGVVEADRILRTLSVGLDFSEGRKRQLQINGQKARLEDYLSLLQVIAYSSARLDIIRGGPEDRRRFLDRGLATVRADYVSDSAKYSKIVKQRNALLADLRERRGSSTALYPWDEELVAMSLKIIRARREYLDALRPEFERLISENNYHVEGIEFLYEPAGFLPEDDHSSALKRLRELRRRELAAGFSLAGPHRDRLEIMTSGRDVAEVLSSGETKMVILFLKLSKVAVFRKLRETNPLFLLDDIDAELDIGITERLVGAIVGKTQLVTSSAKEAIFRDLSLGPHRLFQVSSGEVKVIADQ